MPPVCFRENWMAGIDFADHLASGVSHSNTPGTKPHSARSSISFSMEIPEVVSISPEMAAFAPDKKHAFPLSGSSPRPPASRIAALGSRNRNIAIVRRISG